MNGEVRERRETREMSPADPAAAVGVTRQTIDSIECDRYDPSPALAFELAEFFDCRIEEPFRPERGGQ